MASISIHQKINKNRHIGMQKAISSIWIYSCRNHIKKLDLSSSDQFSEASHSSDILKVPTNNHDAKDKSKEKS